MKAAAGAGYATATIALIKGALGSTMGLAGAAVGGMLAFRAGRRNATVASEVNRSSHSPHVA